VRSLSEAAGRPSRYPTPSPAVPQRPAERFAPWLSLLLLALLVKVLLASLTLVAQEEGVRQARNEARGATFGTLGLLAFAVVLAVLVGRAPVWLGAGCSRTGPTARVEALEGWLDFFFREDGRNA